MGAVPYNKSYTSLKQLASAPSYRGIPGFSGAVTSVTQIGNNAYPDLVLSVPEKLLEITNLGEFDEATAYYEMDNPAYVVVVNNGVTSKHHIFDLKDHWELTDPVQITQKIFPKTKEIALNEGMDS